MLHCPRRRVVRVRTVTLVHPEAPKTRMLLPTRTAMAGSRTVIAGTRTAKWPATAGETVGRVRSVAAHDRCSTKRGCLSLLGCPLGRALHRKAVVSGRAQTHRTRSARSARDASRAALCGRYTQWQVQPAVVP
jgi:hypothetical protein